MICRDDSLGCLVLYESDDDSDFVELASRHAPTSEGIVAILLIKIICRRHYTMTHLPLPLPFTIVGESDPAGSMTQAATSPPSRDTSKAYSERR